MPMSDWFVLVQFPDVKAAHAEHSCTIKAWEMGTAISRALAIINERDHVKRHRHDTAKIVCRRIAKANKEDE